MDYIDKAIRLQSEILEATNNANFYDRLYLAGQDPEENFYNCEHYMAQIRALQEEYKMLCELYDQKQNTYVNGPLYYALTIGSPEKEDIQPCLELYNRFKESKDMFGARIEGYFEKGKKSGYVHIHAIVERKEKFPRSKSQLASRHGKYRGKQHNFDLIRLSGLAIPKWKNYIKKDSMGSWNTKVNETLKNEECSI
jgi:hypothetical protein